MGGSVRVVEVQESWLLDRSGWRLSDRLGLWLLHGFLGNGAGRGPLHTEDRLVQVCHRSLRLGLTMGCLGVRASARGPRHLVVGRYGNRLHVILQQRELVLKGDL